MTMKRVIPVLILIHLFGNSVFSFGETAEPESDAVMVNYGIGFLYPLSRKTSPGLNVLASVIFLSGTFGVGKCFNVIPDILMPGIYGDVHFSLISILLAQGGGSIKLENADGDNSSLPFIFQGGLCLYNKFRFGLFDIQPSAGFNAIMGSLKPGMFAKYGISAAYGNIGLEYSYQLPFTGSIKKDFPYLHRLVFIYRVY